MLTTADTAEAGIEERSRAHPSIGEGQETEGDQLDSGGIGQEDVGEEFQCSVCARGGRRAGWYKCRICKEGRRAQARIGESCKRFRQGLIYLYENENYFSILTFGVGAVDVLVELTAVGVSANSCAFSTPPPARPSST